MELFSERASTPDTDTRTTPRHQGWDDATERGQAMAFVEESMKDIHHVDNIPQKVGDVVDVFFPQTPALQMWWTVFFHKRSVWKKAAERLEECSNLLRVGGQ